MLNKNYDPAKLFLSREKTKKETGSTVVRQVKARIKNACFDLLHDACPSLFFDFFPIQK